MKYAPIILAFILLSGCCTYDEKDFEFDETELKLVSVYKTNDTIYFENQRSDLDTILIVAIDKDQKKECGNLMARPAENYEAIIIKHLPKDNWHGTEIEDGKVNNILYQSLFSICKYPQNKMKYFSISFKNFYWGSKNMIDQLQSDTITLNEMKFTNYYVLQNEFPKNDINPNLVETVYWTNDHGLIAYKNKGGDLYTVKRKK